MAGKAAIRSSQGAKVTTLGTGGCATTEQNRFIITDTAWSVSRGSCCVARPGSADRVLPGHPNVIDATGPIIQRCRAQRSDTRQEIRSLFRPHVQGIFPKAHACRFAPQAKVAAEDGGMLPAAAFRRGCVSRFPPLENVKENFRATRVHKPVFGNAGAMVSSAQ